MRESKRGISVEHIEYFVFAICHRDIIEIRDLIVDEWAKESHGNLASSGELRSFRNEALVYYSVMEFTTLQIFTVEV